MGKKIIILIALIVLVGSGIFVLWSFSHSVSIEYENEFNKLSASERDLIRTDDIKQLKLALEFYYEDEGEYPRTTNVEEVTGYDNSLVSALSPKYLMYKQLTYNSFPLDPLTPEMSYTYKSDGNGYILTANLETQDMINIEEGPMHEDGLQQDSKKESINVDFTDYYFSVDAQNANLADLFDEITSKTGVKIAGDIPQDYIISVYFDRKGFTRGMNEIVAKIKPGVYEGNFQLGMVFSESTYYVRKKSSTSIETENALAVSYNEEGEELLSENKIDEAYSFFIKSLISNPRYLPAHKNLVTVYEQQEIYSRMIERAQKIIVLEPSNPENYGTLADAYRLDCQYGNSLKNYVIFLEMTKDKKLVEKINSEIENIKSESWKTTCHIV